MSDLGAPDTDEEINAMIEKFMSVGMKYAEAEAAIGTHKRAFKKASHEHRRNEKKRL
jgi:hypothetical protein